MCDLILDVVGLIKSLSRDTELECLLSCRGNDAWFKMGLDHMGDFCCIHVRVFAHAISVWRDPSFRGNGMAERKWSTSRSLDFIKITFSPAFLV